MNRKLIMLVVFAAMAALMLAVAGMAWAQECPPGDIGCNPDEPPPPPPPDNGGGGNGGDDGGNGGSNNGGNGDGGGNGGNNGGGFIHFGVGYPFSGTTTVDFGAFPVGGFDGGFSVTTQPTTTVVVTQPAGGTTMADRTVSDTFDGVGID